MITIAELRMATGAPMTKSISYQTRMGILIWGITIVIAVGGFYLLSVWVDGVW